MAEPQPDARVAQLLEAVRRAAERVPLVQLAYVFGSQLGDRARANSDLDVAVAFAPGADPSARTAAMLGLIDALTAELGPLGERTDLVDLERAGAAVAFRAIRDGHCVLARDRRRQVELEARTARRYDDEAPKRELFRRAAIEAARRMGEEAKRGQPEAIGRRLLSLNEALQHLSARAQRLDAAELNSDAVLRAAVERWLQIAIEACIDLAYHVIAERGWTAPDTSRGAFTTLAAHGLIPPELAARLGQAAGMRNILVHEYAEVDLEVVTGVIRDGLTDLRQFGAIMGKLLSDATA